MRIGILALQGAFAEHERIITELGHNPIQLRQQKDLADLDGIILPGGESTVQGKLLRNLGMLDAVRNMICRGLPTLATCAGLILLAEQIEGEPHGHLATLPVTVRRNAYGRQLSSFAARSPVDGLGEFPLVFIRAPSIVRVSDGVKVLASLEGKAVAVQWRHQMGLAFHPELSGDNRLHSSFLSLCKEAGARS